MLFLEDNDWSPPEEWPELEGTVALDFETRDPAMKTHGAGWAFTDSSLSGEIVGVAVAGDFGSAYLPFGHRGGGNLPKEMVLSWLKAQLAKPDLNVVVHNGLYEYGYLSRYGIPVLAKFHDTMTAAPLIDENRMSYSLDSLGKSYVGERKDEKGLRQAADAYGLKDPKADMWRLPANFVGPYAEQDAKLTLKLWKRFREIMSEQNLWDIYNLEVELIPLLVAMRMRGVRVDTDGAERLAKDILKKEDEIKAQIKSECGRCIDVWSALDIAKAFDARGVSYPRTKKTNAPSFTQKWLEAHPDPISKLIVKSRKINKNRTTFVEGHILGHAVNGRIHAEFAPLKRQDDDGTGGGTVTGRFSAFSPNLQQIPSLDKDRESGLMIRSLLLPEEGEKWGALDYSQQEPRLTVHYAALMKCEGADEAVRKYNEDPKTDYHSLIAEMTGLPRNAAKILNLGIAYGMGGPKLCRGLGLPTETVEGRNGKTYEIAGKEGQEILDAYHKNAPFIKELFDACAARAEERGFIRTILGRRRRFKTNDPTAPDTGYADYPYKAMNALIQGSAADQVKKAMLNMWKEGIVPLVTVHDEVGISTASKEFTKKCVDIMLECVPLLVPSKVDAEVGLNWGHANETKGTE